LQPGFKLFFLIICERNSGIDGVTNETSLILIIIQTDATVCRYLFTAKLLYRFRVSQHPSSGVLKTVTAASGTGHNTGAATPSNVADHSTLEGSSCTSIMTCTGGCGYILKYS